MGKKLLSLPSHALSKCVQQIGVKAGSCLLARCLSTWFEFERIYTFNIFHIIPSLQTTQQFLESKMTTLTNKFCLVLNEHELSKCYGLNGVPVKFTS